MAARRSIEVFECEGEVLRAAVRDGPLDGLLFGASDPVLDVPAGHTIGPLRQRFRHMPAVWACSARVMRRHGNETPSGPQTPMDS